MPADYRCSKHPTTSSDPHGHVARHVQPSIRRSSVPQFVRHHLHQQSYNPRHGLRAICESADRRRCWNDWIQVGDQPNRLDGSDIGIFEKSRSCLLHDGCVYSGIFCNWLVHGIQEASKDELNLGCLGRSEVNRKTSEERIDGGTLTEEDGWRHIDGGDVTEKVDR